MPSPQRVWDMLLMWSRCYQVCIRAPIRFPRKAVTFVPLLESLSLMAIKLLAGTLIHLKKVLYHAFIIKFPIHRQYPSETDMLNMVTPIAQGNESNKRLYMRLIVIGPSLVTIQPALRSTDPTPVAVLGIDFLAKFVPFLPPHGCPGVQVPE